MSAAAIILGALCGVCLAYAAYLSWATGAADGFDANGPSTHSVAFRALYISGYRIGAEARRIERLNRGER